jgi:transposase
MARRSDLGDEVVKVMDETPAAKRRRETHQARRAEALSLVLAGLSYEAVGERLGISKSAAIDMVGRSLDIAETRAVDEMRAVENARLDRAQAAIWTKVLNGDEKAIATFISISQRRSRLNGLDAPTRINLKVSVQAEMEAALNELEAVVLKGEVISRHDETDAERDSDADH